MSYGKMFQVHQWEIQSCTWEVITIRPHFCTFWKAVRCPSSQSNPMWKPYFQVNVGKPRVYLVVNLSSTLVTFVVNLWAGVSILKKERTRIHILIVCDCVVNVVSSLHTSFLQSPLNMLGSPAPCLVHTLLLNLLISWNRLVKNCHL